MLMFVDRFSNTIKIIKKAAIGIAGLVLFLLILELIRAYQTLYTFTPILGYFFVFGIVLFVSWLGYNITKTVLSLPKKIKVPPYDIRNPHRSKVKYLKYLHKYAHRLLSNANIPADKKMALIAIRQDIQKHTNVNDEQSVQNAINRLENEVLDIGLSYLDEEAENIVRDSVRDNILAVTFSPFRTTDSLFVIYRNLSMFNQILRIYKQRPAITEFFQTMKDVLKIVVGVNILNYTQKFTEKLMSKIPLLDRATDDILQGIGAGILTTSVGKATIRRGRCYKQWDPEKELENFGKSVSAFLSYVRGIITKDVLPRFTRPFEKNWDKIKSFFTKKTPEKIS